jgi:hypothetical protein
MAITVLEMVGKLTGDTSDFDKSMSGAGKTATTTGQHIKRAAFVAATAITGGLVVAAKIGWDEFQSGQLVAAQTNTVLESTGKVANVSAGHVKDLAIQLMNKSGVDDQVIRSGENLLLTFMNVRNEVGEGRDIFDQATKAALDMSVATGRDLTSATRSVGRALNDPIKGLSMLTRMGVRFTAEEKEQIATMVEHNNIIGAQQLVLSKLNTVYGGSADISGTVAGKMAIAREQFKNVAETLVGALLPAITSILAPIASLAEFFGRHTTVTKILVGVLITLVPILYAVSAATKIVAAAQAIATATTWLFVGSATKAAAVTRIWAAVQWLLNAALIANPIGIIIVAVAALAVAIVVAYRRSETFRAVVSAAIDFVRRHWQLLLLAFGVLPFLIVKAIRSFGTFRSIAVAAFNAVIGPIRTVVGAISMLLGWINSAISAVGRLASAIRSIPRPPDITPGFNIPGFQSGGVVPGPIGQPQLAVVHGGERITPAGRASSAGAVNNFYFPRYLGDRRALVTELRQALDELRRANGGRSFF